MPRSRTRLVSISLLGLTAALWANGAWRLAAEPVADDRRAPVDPALPLPEVRVDPAARPTHAKAKRPPPRIAAAPAPPAAPQQVAVPPNIQTGAAGTNGYVAGRSVTGTKTDTPLLDIPQSITVLTRDFLDDLSFPALTDAIRYVPGVIPHQGESNRDDVVIRGQRSNADFYVNGIRDDVQYMRDLYNTYRLEVLKGPNAMIFGRGGGGGVINRVLKEADFVPRAELALQGGMFDNRRAALDLGGAFDPALAGRLAAVVENSDSYRRFVTIERYGVNPTLTWRPNDATLVKLAYEYFHDRRTTDRGIPSQNGRPYPTDPSTFFGNPQLNVARVDAHIATAQIRHETDSGIKIVNSSRFADYDKFYQNVFPGGPVNAAGTSVNLTAYNNETDRRNLFNQTDVSRTFDLGITRHTVLVGTEVGRQTGLAFRQDGFFNNLTQTLAVSPLDPVSYTPVTFRNIATGANHAYALDLAAAYAQDQIEITRYLQFVLGVRLDRFNLSSTDRRTAVTRSRADNLLSPRAGVVIKPWETVSFYGSYSISYLPSAGDQFSTLTPGTAIAAPELFENHEVGVKWEITRSLVFTSAVYELERSNQRLADPANPGFFLLSGRTMTRGFEAAVTGSITDAWQVVAGYAYTDARIASATSATITAGKRVALVPYNVLTLWSKYQFTERFAAGIGLIHQTRSYASSDDSVVLPGWTRVDAAIYGRLNAHLRWQVNAENIFNTRYYATADGNNNITPGSPFAVRGTLVASY